jgi:ankyrin repeat protein
MKQTTIICYCILAFIIPIFNITLVKALDIYEQDYWKNISISEVKDILASKKDILNLKTEEQEGDTFFVYAVLYCKNLEIIRYLIKQGGDVNYKSAFQQTPLLHRAIYVNIPLAIIQELINSGANVNQVDTYNITSLMLAMKESNMPVVEVLINNGADLNVVDIDGVGLEGYAYGDIADSSIYQQRIKPFAKRSLPHTCFFWYRATVDDVIELAKSNYDFNQSFRFDKKILMYAAEATTNPDVICELIKYDNNVNYISEYGDKNALFFAIDNFKDNNNLHAIEALISANISLNIIDSNGNTALSKALYNGTPELIELLIHHNAKLPKNIAKEDLLISVKYNKSLKNSLVYEKNILPMIQEHK